MLVEIGSYFLMSKTNCVHLYRSNKIFIFNPPMMMSKLFNKTNLKNQLDKMLPGNEKFILFVRLIAVYFMKRNDQFNVCEFIFTSN